MGGQAVALQLDTSDTKNFDSFVAQLKQSLQSKWQTEQLDFLVNNAGIGINKPFAETTEDDFDRLMNIQLKGVFFLIQYFPHSRMKDVSSIFLRSYALYNAGLCRLWHHDGGDTAFAQTESSRKGY
jgi:NAD(P)-dependent dehydrogenase (short-subunit alcohol dehydrogenase family)